MTIEGLIAFYDVLILISVEVSLIKSIPLILNLVSLPTFVDFIHHYQLTGIGLVLNS